MKAFKWIKGVKSKKTQPLEEHEKVTVVLAIHLHCPQCAVEAKRFCEKIKGVESVEIDTVTSQATVKGAFDVEKLVDRFLKKANKVVKVVSVETQENGDGVHEDGSGPAHEDKEEDDDEDEQEDLSPFHSPPHE